MSLPKYNNILLIGSRGNVGSVLVEELRKLNVGNVIAPEQNELDYFNKEQLFSYLEKFKPELIYLVGAYTNVDGAEDDKELCNRINVDGIDTVLKNIVSFSKKDEEYTLTVIYISTEMVGKVDHPLSEEENVWNPIVALNEYGKTKALAEKLVREIHSENSNYFNYRILRICFPIAGWRRGSIFTLLKNTVGEGKKVSLVTDEIQTLTYIPYTAYNSLLLSEYGENGVYHDAMLPKENGQGYSPYEMGLFFAQLMNYDTSLIGEMKHQDMYEKGWWKANRGLSAELKVGKGLQIDGWKSGNMSQIIHEFVDNN